MFTIFNAGSFIVFALSILYVGIVDFFIPDFASNRFANLAFCLVFLFLSVLFEIVGSRQRRKVKPGFTNEILFSLFGMSPRIFHIPCWLLGLVGISISLYKLVGWFTIATSVFALIVLVYLFYIIAVRREKQEWNTLQDMIFSYLKDPGSCPDNKKYLYHCFFNNEFIDNTPEILEHNKIVVETIIRDCPDIFSENEKNVFRSYIDEIRDMIGQNRMSWKDISLHRRIYDILKEKMRIKKQAFDG